MNQPPFFQRTRWLLFGIVALTIGAPALADPPGRVARLSYLNGSVSYEPAGTQDWVQAVPNRPLVTGDSIWADSDSRAELNLGRVAARLDSQTSLTVTNLDDDTAQFQLAQGTMELTVRHLEPGDNVEIDTPNLAFSVTSAGTYRLNVAADGSSTFVAVESGQGNVTGQGQAYTIGNRQAYSFSGTDLSNSAYFDVPAPDDFDRFAASRDRRVEASPSARYVSHDMIGYEDLDDHGQWQDVEGYGHVWLPTEVDAGWAPYRSGHWAWVDPWGWTWVDDAAWGFAPFHYGRWAQVGPRWGWIPGPIGVVPVYAPALVAFVGGTPGVGVSVSLGLGGAVGVGIGWFPLGPREVFRPAYAVSPTYVNRVNVSNTTVTNTYVTNVVNNTTVVNNYANQKVPGAVTAVPASAFAQGTSVSKVGVTVPTNLAVKAQAGSVAAVTPTAHAVAPSAAASFRPPASTMARPMVAATQPPPAAVPFAAKQQALAQNPGRPLTPEATASVRASLPPSVHAATVRPVTVVKSPAPASAGAARPAPPAQAARPAEVQRPLPSKPLPQEVQNEVHTATPAARPATPEVARPPTPAVRPATPPQSRPAPEAAQAPVARPPQSVARPAVEAPRPQVQAPSHAPVEPAHPAAEVPHPAAPHPEAHPPHEHENGHGEKKE